MSQKGYTAEQIINKLREAEVMTARGETIECAIRKIGLTKNTFYRWRKEYGRMRVDQARRLKELEIEKSRLKRLVVEYYSVDLMASVIRNGVILGGASIDRGIDLSFLHGFHSFEGISLEVVGHKCPVRLRPVDGEVTSEFVHAVKNLIIEKI
ncbi:MAG: transposase [bacterium]